MKRPANGSKLLFIVQEVLLELGHMENSVTIVLPLDLRPVDPDEDGGRAQCCGEDKGLAVRAQRSSIHAQLPM